MRHHEIDLLLSCRDIYIEEVEAAVFIPSVGEIRKCHRHGQVTVIKVGTPYWVDDNEREEVKKDN